MAVLSNTGIRAGASAAVGDSGYKVEKSLRFNPGDSAYLSHTPSSSSPAFAQQQFTISFWTKVEGSPFNTLAWCTAGATSGTTGLLQFYIEYGKVTINGNGAYMQSNRRLTDPSAWYHITLAVDTTLSTANDRMKVWVNNERITDWASNTTVGQDASFIWNTNVVHRIGGMYNSGGSLGSYLNGYLADFHSIDGQVLDPSSFGETDSTTGKWIPKEYTGTHGPLVNQSQTWSDSVTNPSGAYGVAANAFDGSLTTHASPNYANPMTYTNASPSDTVIQTFEVKCDIYTMTGITVELNDTDITSQLTTTDKWHTITGFTGEQFEKFYWRPTSVNYEVKIKAFRINGKILVDDDVTITNNGFYFKFNGSNLGEDSSGQDNDWTVNNLTAGGTNFDVPCVKFDGTNDYLEIADHADLGFGSGDFTVECFVNPNTPGSNSYHSIVGSSQSTYSSSSFWFTLYSKTDGTSNMLFYYYHGSNGNYANSGYVIPHGKWSHIVGTRDGNNLRVYFNGVQQASIDVSSYAAMNDSSSAVRIGSDVDGNYDMNGAISNLRIVKGTCLYPDGTTFTVPSRPLTNVTNTKLLCCQSSSSTTTAAVIPSGSITATGDVVATTKSDDESDSDQLRDTPTDFDDDGNGTGNYCTLNPLDREDTSLALTNGNLQVNRSSGSAWKLIRSSMRMDSGAWYWEMDVLDADQNSAMGVCTFDTGGFFAGGTYQDFISYSSFTTGDIWGVAYDADNGTLDYYKNGTIQSGASETGVPKGLFAAASIYGPYSSSSNPGFIFNFGQRAFAHTPPSGYKALNTYNLPDPVITEPNKYFDTKLYTGTGASHAITGLNFSPDLVWIKKYTTASHAIFDTVRGVHKRLQSDGVLAVDDDSTTLTAFGTEGFTLSTHDDVNQNTDSYVSWNWDAGSSNTSVSAGGLNSTVYNTSADWSSSSTLTNPGGAFDGTDMGGSSAANYSSSGNTLTTSAITINSKLEIYTNRTHSGATDGTKVTINSTDYYDKALSANGWSEVDLSGATLPLTTSGAISIEDEGGSASGLWGVRVDGKILVDDDGTPDNVPTIASTYRANPSAGFSIVSYEGNATSGATIAHGLNAKPDFAIFKAHESAGYAWYVYHKDIGNTHHLYLNYNSGKNDDSGAWNDTDPDSNVMTLGNAGNVADNNGDMIAYLWSEVEGYSKFGSFAGDGTTDGPFVWCGFRPAWIVFKRTDSSYGWNIYDQKRDPYNEADVSFLYADTTAANTDGDEGAFDMLSNGFKMKGNWNINNASGGTYVFAAFAESPFKYSNAR